MKKEELPLGFQMALSKNFCAMKYFSNLSKTKQMEIIKKAKTIKGKEQMQEYITELGNIRG